jgi:OOP family OmpA-OmpF porin
VGFRRKPHFVRTAWLLCLGLATCSAPERVPAPPPMPPAPIQIHCQAGPFDIFFDPGSDAITESAAAILDNAAAAFRAGCGLDRVTIGGHTDRSAIEKADPTLSQRRADKVKQYLIARTISATAIKTEAFGATRLLADTPDGVADARNRRVEVMFSFSFMDDSK